MLPSGLEIKEGGAERNASFLSAITSFLEFCSFLLVRSVLFFSFLGFFFLSWLAFLLRKHEDANVDKKNLLVKKKCCTKAQRCNPLASAEVTMIQRFDAISTHLWEE